MVCPEKAYRLSLLNGHCLPYITMTIRDITCGGERAPLIEALGTAWSVLEGVLKVGGSG